MKLNEIIKERQIKIEAKAGLIKEYTKNIADLDKQIKALTEKEAIILDNMNLDKVLIAESILECQGRITNECGAHESNGFKGEVLADLASVDIANGCPRLKKEYFGNKEYDRFYQRCDSPYGMGPRHGYIVDSIGLKTEYRDKVLSDEEKDACIYYLKNYVRIQNLKQTAKA